MITNIINWNGEIFENKALLFLGAVPQEKNKYSASLGLKSSNRVNDKKHPENSPFSKSSQIVYTENNSLKNGLWWLLAVDVSGIRCWFAKDQLVA
jgi:hypothetical protein